MRLQCRRSRPVHSRYGSAATGASAACAVQRVRVRVHLRYLRAIFALVGFDKVPSPQPPPTSKCNAMQSNRTLGLAVLAPLCALACAGAVARRSL